jgi:cardiolipin synthase (CMP-forming)
VKFGERIVTVPNLLSISRIVFIPLFIYLMSLRSLHGWIGALIIFFVASFTDLLDGWSARKLKQESEFGKFIDPLADKFLVISSLVVIIVMDPYLEIIDFWMILIIVGRDILITMMRYLAIKRGAPLKTSRFGKIKTAFQMMSIGIIILIYIVRVSGFAVTHRSVPYWIMLGVTVLTALSGVRYLIVNWRLFLPEKKEGVAR